jgi:hypothetical protein
VGASIIEITEDTSDTLTTEYTVQTYYYLKDTGIVYIEYAESYTPVISSQGYYLRYDTDTNSVKEIK